VEVALSENFTYPKRCEEDDEKNKDPISDMDT
jgi:hypothetical protein